METNVVYFKDSRNMAEVDDESVTLVVTSPPYYNIKDYSKDGYQKALVSAPLAGQIGDISSYEEYQDELLNVWKDCERVLQPNGKLCINTPLMPILKKQRDTHYLRDMLDINAGIEQRILRYTTLYLLDIWIWNRANPTKRLMFGSYPHPPNFYAQNTVEFIAVFAKDGPPRERPPHIKEGSKLTQEEWVKYTKQVWDIPIPNRADVAYGKHPAIMPLEIAYRLIKLFSFVGDIVLDPFLGSGTTARAAEVLGRRWIGYEIDPKFKAVIERKLERQPALL